MYTNTHMYMYIASQYMNYTQWGYILSTSRLVRSEVGRGGGDGVSCGGLSTPCTASDKNWGGRGLGSSNRATEQTHTFNKYWPHSQVPPLWNVNSKVVQVSLVVFLM